MDSSLIKVNETITELRSENEHLRERNEQLSSQVRRCLEELKKQDKEAKR